jgi:hypothetical protein
MNPRLEKREAPQTARGCAAENANVRQPSAQADTASSQPRIHSPWVLSHSQSQSVTF